MKYDYLNTLLKQLDRHTSKALPVLPVASRLDKAKDRDGEAAVDIDLVASVRTQEVGQLGAYRVWLVDGRAVRESIDLDFVSGGNPARYGYVPENELWAEQSLGLEIFPTVLHEFVECELMKIDGLDYEKAHDKALQFETAYRNARPDGGDLIRVKLFLGIDD